MHAKTRSNLLSNGLKNRPYLFHSACLDTNKNSVFYICFPAWFIAILLSSNQFVCFSGGPHPSATLCLSACFGGKAVLRPADKQGECRDVGGKRAAALWTRAAANFHLYLTNRRITGFVIHAVCFWVFFPNYWMKYLCLLKGRFFFKDNKENQTPAGGHFWDSHLRPSDLHNKSSGVCLSILHNLCSAVTVENTNIWHQKTGIKTVCTILSYH